MSFGVLGVGVGLVLLVAGVAWQWPLGVAGFLVMLAGGWWASTGWQGGAASVANSPKAASKSPQKSGFMSRIEERWERRRDGEQ